MNIIKFGKEIPKLEGYIIGNLRIVDKREVVGFVLEDKKGKKRYILYFGDDLKVVDYW